MIVELQTPPRKYLSERDAELAKLISHVGEYQLNLRSDYFGSLVKLPSPGYPIKDVIATLTQVKGIGRWTAEIFLIFSLGRQDILPLDDVGLQRAVKWLYRLAETPKAEQLREYGEQWRPFRSVASLYLWEVINRNLIVLDTDVLGR